MSKIPVFFTDDHKIVRDGIYYLLGDDSNIEVVGTSPNADDTLEALKDLDVKVLVTDLSLPGMSGIELLIQVRKLYPEINVLVLTMHEEHEFILECVTNGAKGYVLKDCSKFELVEAIKLVASGGTYYSSVVAEKIVESYSKTNPWEDPEISKGLTRREFEVLEKIVEGFSNKQIAYELNISVRTVDTHRRHIMKKLDAHNTAMIVSKAISEGLVKV